MLSNYYTLSALAGEAAPSLIGRTISQAFSQEKDEVVFSFEPPAPSLVISCRPDANVFFLHPGFARARRNSADVLPGTIGRSIGRISIHPSDRIVLLALDDGRQIAGLFFGGSAANVLLVANDGAIEAAFRKNKTLAGTAFSPRAQELVYDTGILSQLSVLYPAHTLEAALRKAYPSLGEPLTRELLFRAGVRRDQPATTLTADDETRMAVALHELLIAVQHPLPRVYLDPEGRPLRFALFPLQSMEHSPERSFLSIHEAVRFFVARRRQTGALEEEKLALCTHIRSCIEKAQRTIRAVETDTAMVPRIKEYDRYGTILLANPAAFRKGETHVVLEGETIPLNRALTPVQNAQQYFEKAKRARTAWEQAQERTRQLLQSVARGEAAVAAIEAVNSPEELKQLMVQKPDDFAEFGVGTKGVEEPLPFRRFIVEGGFEVWAGKSSENNDDLTLHHAKPNDLWFHARGSSGSHVILRIGTGRGEPSKKAKEQAAAVAAYYSKMKNAGLVPVAMTEKRYVRKPKGAKAGSVVIEREKVLFVRPALPAEPQ